MLLTFEWGGLVCETLHDFVCLPTESNARFCRTPTQLMRAKLVAIPSSYISCASFQFQEPEFTWGLRQQKQDHFSGPNLFCGVQNSRYAVLFEVHLGSRVPSSAPLPPASWNGRSATADSNLVFAWIISIVHSASWLGGCPCRFPGPLLSQRTPECTCVHGLLWCVPNSMHATDGALHL